MMPVPVSLTSTLCSAQWLLVKEILHQLTGEFQLVQIENHH